MAKEPSKKIWSLFGVGLGVVDMTGSESAAARPSGQIQSLWCITKDVIKITFWIFCILWHILIITMFLDIKISGSTIVFTLCLVFATMLLLIAVFAGIGILEDRKAETPNGSTIFPKYNSFKLILLRGWGMLFRTLFISLVGIAGYHWIDPQPIGNVSLLDLTLRQFFSNLFVFLLALGCIVWFFRFPNNKNHAWTNDPKQNSYLLWGIFGVLLIMLTIMVVAYGGMLLKNL